MKLNSIKRGLTIFMVISLLAHGGVGMNDISAHVDAKAKKIVQCASKKYSYKSMEKDMKQLVKRYPQYCHYEVIGKTKQGRNIYDFVIGSQDAKKSLLVVSTLHAREYVCSATSMRIAEYYLDNYNKSIQGIKPSKVFSSVQLHIVAMANPDGVMISQTKQANWKSNANGVDLNRNFPYYFRKRGKKGSEEFSGKKAASEKETQAIMQLTQQLKKEQKLCAQVNYHAMGEIIFGDYGGKNKYLKKQITKMYKIAQAETGYTDSSGYSAPSNGNYREYVMYKTKVPSITIEVGSTSCPVSYWEYDSIFKKNKNVLLRIANEYK